MPSAKHRPPAQVFSDLRYFPSLDGLRTLSIVPVVWHHSTPWPYQGLLGRGPVGVDLFFAISGFLITTLLLRERTQHGKVDLAAFYVRRSFRIFPLYYLALGLHAAFALGIRTDWGPSRTFLERLPAYATYTANWLGPSGDVGPLLFAFAWSLCTEEQFYAFWAPVLAWSRKLGLAATLMAGWLCLDLLLEFGYCGWSRAMSPFCIRVIESFATSIGFGALGALAIHERRLGFLWSFFGSRWASPLLGAFVASLVLWAWAPTALLHFALALWVVACATRPNHGLVWLLEGRLVRAVGRVSYGIYLWHVPVIGAIRAVLPSARGNAAIVFALALPLSFLAAATSYALLEQPMLRVGANLLRRRARRDGYDANTSAESASTVSSSAL